MRARDFAYFDQPFIPLAHRGGALLEANRGRENTLEAFGEAVSLGYRYLETDVHATRDGHLVAFHDAALAFGTASLLPPRIWPEYHMGYFGAFVRDPDGNNVEAVSHLPV